MCDPVTIGVGVAALGVGEAVVGHIGQNQMAAANRDAANYNYARDLQTISEKRVQLDAEKSESAFDTAIAAAQSTGRITNAASDQGLGNSSFVQAINADMFGLGRQASIESLNDQNARNNLAAEAEGADISRQNQILSKPRAGAASLLLGVGKGVASGFTAARSASAPRR